MNSLPQRKQIFNVNNGRKDGLILQLNCSTLEKYQNARETRFVHVAFNETGQILVAATCHGDIYNFNFTQCRCWHLTNTSSCTFLKFNLLNDEEIFIGKNNGVVNIVDVESGQLVSTLKGHKHPVKDASFARDFLCVTSSANDAIVWDLRSYTKVQALCISAGVVLKQVMFMPISDNILTVFNDDSIHIWKYGTFDHIKQIQPALWNKFIVKCLAFTRNGRILVLGGYSQHLAVFLVDTWNLEKTIVLPTPITVVKKLDFLSQPFDGGSNRILSVLASNGTIYFYDMQQDVILNKLTFSMEISRYDSSYDGRYIACVISDGKADVYLLAPYITTCDDGTKQTINVESKMKKKLKVKKRSTSAMYVAKEKIDNVLEIQRLLSILKQYGQYPDMHRSKIWIQLLQLPNNVQGYQILNSKYAEAPSQDLERKYPIENRVLLKNLKKLLFTLRLWCPFFGEVAYLPLFTFPFVKVFQYDPLVCFEAIVTILINWCQHWFEYYPLPPINVLAMVENVFLHHDASLLQHLTSNGVTSKLYAWPLMQTSFSEALSSKDWLIIWDHILSNEPSFVIMVTVAYNLLQRQHLMALSDPKDFKVFYHKQNLVDVKRLVSKAYHLLESTEEVFHPRRYLENFRKLDVGAYPTFVDYPKVAMDYQKHLENVQSEKLMSSRQGTEMVEKITQENENIEEIHRKIEENIRMKEVNRVYKQTMEMDQEDVFKQKLRLAHLKDVFENKTAYFSIISPSQNDNKLYLDKCFENNPHLDFYKKFLETDYALQAYTMTDCHRVSILHTHQLEIDGKITEVIKMAKAVTDKDRYLAQLAAMTGLAVLEKIITQLRMKIKECASKNKCIDQNYLNFMTEQIDLTENRVELILENSSAEDLKNILSNDLMKLTSFRSSTCEESEVSTASD